MDKHKQDPDMDAAPGTGRRTSGTALNFGLREAGSAAAAPGEPEVLVWFARADQVAADSAAPLHNPAAQSLTSGTLASWVGRIHPEDAAERERVLSRALQAQTRCELQLRLLDGSSGQEVLRETVHPVFDDAGSCLGFVGICAEQMQWQADGQSLQRGPRWDALIAALAHALRNPLAPLTISGNLLARGSLGPDDLPRTGRMIEQQARQIAAVVAELEQVAKVVDSRVGRDWHAQRPADIVDAALVAVAPLIAAAGHEVVVDYGELAWIYADPDGLVQALTHLLRNAVQHTPDRGRLEIRVRTEGNRAEIRVKDNGSGIAPSALPRLFEPFHAGRGLSRLHQGGLGLGLFITRSWVELHGGLLLAASAGIGCGAEFTMRLPAVTAAAAAGPLPPLRHRVLLVEDQADIADSTVMALEYLGAEVAAAKTGAEALQRAQEFQPTLVLIDIGLPDIDGHEVARRLRELPQFARTPMVALSSWGDPETRKRSGEVGIHEHLVKPLDIDGLDLLLQRTPVDPAA